MPGNVRDFVSFDSVGRFRHRFWQRDRYANCKVPFTLYLHAFVQFSPLSFLPLPPSFERGKKSNEEKPDEILHLTFAFIFREKYFIYVITNQRFIFNDVIFPNFVCYFNTAIKFYINVTVNR